MLISFNWLKEFLTELNLTPKETADTLTMAGLEIESLEQCQFSEEEQNNGKDPDYILDVNITPNRADCLSTLGIARELSAILKIPLKIPHIMPVEENFVSSATIEIENPELCHRYTAKIIKNVKIAQSPKWIKDRLEKCAIRSITNVVDITNYALLELGQPLHAFDLNTLCDRKTDSNKTIRIASAKTPVDIITLDNVKRTVPPHTLLIWDCRRPIAIAGIMGGLTSQVTDETKDILLESAWFEPTSIRKTSKLLNLKSDSSFRFERGIDILNVPTALERAACLIKELCGGSVSNTIDVYPIKYKPKTVKLNTKRASNTIGINITNTLAKDILIALNFKIEDSASKTENTAADAAAAAADKTENSDCCLTAQPPSYRYDIEQEADLYEEIARIHGYDKIPTTAPVVTMTHHSDTSELSAIRQIKNYMRQAGLSEAINFSFMSSKSLETLNINDKDDRTRLLKIKNPLAEHQSHMRTMLLPSVLDNLVYNINRSINNVSLYEISNVFFNNPGSLPKENLNLCAVLYQDDDRKTLWKEPASMFYMIKGLIEGMFANLGITNYETAPSSERFLSLTQSADIILLPQRTKIGCLGALAADVIRKLDIKSAKTIAAAEICLDKNILTKNTELVKYQAIPKYPSIVRDIAILVEQEFPSKTLADLIESYPNSFIESIEIFDSFIGKNLPANKKSLAFRITYRAPHRTLTEKDIAVRHQDLITYVTNKTGGSLR
ncbi:phenylalanyl-tRNA synthetase, beta subunit [Candidatus Magnetoovum chiemensis]|nr:phenylalanyl-tRNA synthetase, beta subunit [Candidatus Magnetoovum chiemensis]